MQGGGLRPLEPHLNMSHLTYSERKYKEKELKEQTEAIGKRHREKTTAALVGVTLKVCLLLGSPTLCEKSLLWFGIIFKGCRC